jgi:hypothetical protein
LKVLQSASDLGIMAFGIFGIFINPRDMFINPRDMFINPRDMKLMEHVCQRLPEKMISKVTI